MRRNGRPMPSARDKKVAAAASTLISYLGVSEAHGEQALLVSMLEHIRAEALRGGRARVSAPLMVSEVDVRPSARLRSEASMARVARRHEGSEAAAHAARAERRGGRHAARQALGALYRNPIGSFRGDAEYEQNRLRLRRDKDAGRITSGEYGDWWRQLFSCETPRALRSWENRYENFLRSNF
jgi:hypothetical protein